MKHRSFRYGILSRASTVVVLSTAAAACSGTDAGDHELAADGQATASGSLRRVIISDQDGHTTGYEFFLETDAGQWLELAVGVDEVPEAAINGEVAVVGESTHSGELRVSRLELISAAQDGTGNAAQELIGPSPRRIAVILMNFSNDTSRPIDVARAREMVFTGATSSNAYFKEISFGIRSLVGKSSVTGDVFGWYTLPNTNAGCNYTAWGTTARNMAQAAGVDLSGYDNIMFYFPRTSACGFSGVAFMPGNYSWNNGSSSSTIAHEFGHNFGAHHASSMNCYSNGQRVSVGGSCSLNEYGDPFDVMGSGYRHMSAYQKGRLGFLESYNTQTLSSGGTFTIAPLETKSLGVQSLRIPIPGTSEYYYVESRRVYGFDSFRATDPVVNGVLVHRAPDYSRLARPGLVDMVPNTATFTDAALGVGRTFRDPSTNISITVNSVSTEGASVTVSLGGGGTTCRSGETAYGGHCYFTLGSSTMIYQGAAWSCALRGAHVAWIESAGENQFLATLTGGTSHWIGADDLTQEGRWVWTFKNQTFWSGGLNGGPVNGAFESFASDEPNGTGDCARITTGGVWRDESCSTPQRVVCERE